MPVTGSVSFAQNAHSNVRVGSYAGPHSGSPSSRPSCGSSLPLVLDRDSLAAKIGGVVGQPFRAAIDVITTVKPIFKTLGEKIRPIAGRLANLANRFFSPLSKYVLSPLNDRIYSIEFRQYIPGCIAEGVSQAGRTLSKWTFEPLYKHVLSPMGSILKNLLCGAFEAVLKEDAKVVESTEERYTLEDLKGLIKKCNLSEFGIKIPDLDTFDDFKVMHKFLKDELIELYNDRPGMEEKGYFLAFNVSMAAHFSLKENFFIEKKFISTEGFCRDLKEKFLWELELNKNEVA